MLIARGDGFRYVRSMNPEAATEIQIERYRQMTGEERVTIGFEMTRRWLEELKEEIQRVHRDVGQEELKKLMRLRIEMTKEGYERLIGARFVP